MRTPESKLIPFAELGALAAKLREAGKVIVTTNGCFDLLHWGHIKYLSEARRQGDLLICGVNSDASVRGLKGEGRPVTPERQRALQVAGLESIDFVCVFPEATPEKFLSVVRPAVHVKGNDYLHKSLPEREIVEKAGGKIVLIPLEDGLSTTSLLAKLRN